MSENAFRDFISQNITAVDELARRYGEYRIEETKSYLDDLKLKLSASVPGGYSYIGAKDQRVIAESEQLFGWTKKFEIQGIITSATIAFGYHVITSQVAGQWPLMNGRCWTGVKVWLPTPTKSAALARGREMAIESEVVDGDWLLWRAWEPLSAASIVGFHTRIFGDERAVDHDEIVAQLEQWRGTFETIVSHLSSTPGNV
jgi:hypothetical protein